jgi:uncharacterized protein (DUF433 family)
MTNVQHEFGIRTGSGSLRFRTEEDRRNIPVYTIDEAADYLGIPVRTLRNWATGRRKPNRSGEFYPPVLLGVDQRFRRLSFFDLVEAHILRAAVEKNVPMKHIKRGMEYIRDRYPDELHPLLSLKFQTDGKYLLIGGMLGSDQNDQEALVNASRNGQLEMTSLIEEYLQLIVRAVDGLPDTLFPKDGKRVVSITTGVLSGRPVIEGTRIPTAIVAQRFLAGEKLAKLASDYQLPEETIEAAIEYERAA